MSDRAQQKLSKQLVKLLRHQAVERGLPLRSDGFAKLDDIRRVLHVSELVLSEDVVCSIVREDNKTRFGMERDEATGQVWLRANQGHSERTAAVLLDREQLLTRVEDAAKYECCVHGTSLRTYREHIAGEGLCRMQRGEIHFASQRKGAKSGMRARSEVLVFVDLAKCLAHGILFYESANGVLLSPGLGERGVIPPEFFSEVVIV